MINLCYRIFCMGTNLWKVYRLCLIPDLCMDTDFLTFSVQSFEYNNQGIL